MYIINLNMKKIRYSKVRLSGNRKSATWMSISGACLIIGAILSGTYSPLDSIGAGVLGSGIVSLIIYFYESKYHYLTIKDGFIRKNTPFSSKMDLAELTAVKKFAGDYVLKTPSREMTIDTQIIDPDSLKELDQILEKLNIPQRMVTPRKTA